MRKSIGWGLAALLVSAALPADAKKGDATEASPVLAEGDRQAPGGRVVLANLYQRDIEASIFVDPIAQTAAPGLLGYFAVRKYDEERVNVIAQRLQATAEANADPVRRALVDFDTAGLALATTRAALRKPAWFKVRDIVASTGPLAQSRVDFFAQNAAEQIASVEYRYDLSHDFTQIRVLANILIERMPPKAGKPTAAPVTIYRQQIMSIVQLRSPSYEARDNARRWSADGGKLAKLALAKAFGEFEQLIPYGLELNQAQMTIFSDKKAQKAFAGGYYGTLISRNATAPENMLIWYKGLINVQTVG